MDVRYRGYRLCLPGLRYRLRLPNVAIHAGRAGGHRAWDAVWGGEAAGPQQPDLPALWPLLLHHHHALDQRLLTPGALPQPGQHSSHTPEEAPSYAVSTSRRPANHLKHTTWRRPTPVTCRISTLQHLPHHHGLSFPSEDTHLEAPDYFVEKDLDLQLQGDVMSENNWRSFSRDVIEVEMLPSPTGNSLWKSTNSMDSVGWKKTTYDLRWAMSSA